MNDFVGYIDDTGKIFDGTFDYEGRVGPIGPQGPEGYSPVRGVDYWTEEDINYVVAEATSLINGKIEEYNVNAEAKTNAFNNNASSKTNAFNQNAENKMSSFNSNASSKTSDFNDNTSSKLESFNSNYTSKTNDFNSNASDKTDAFNSNVTSKTGDFNDNATAKTTAFDAHVEEAFDELTGNFYKKTQTYNKSEVDTIAGGKQNTLTAGTNIDITGDTINVDGYVITPITDYAIRIWNMDEGVYKLSYTTVKYNGSSSNTSITVDGGYLFIYWLQQGTTKGYYLMSDNLSNVYFYMGYTSSDSGVITRLMKKDEIKNNLTTTSEGFMLDARQGKALNESKENISNKTTSISSSSTDSQYPSAKLLYDQLVLRDEAIENLETENEQLLDQIPTATATGTTINVQDSSNLPIKEFDLLGNATQVTTTGKQLFDKTNNIVNNVRISTSSGGTYSADGYSATASGNNRIKVTPSTSYVLTTGTTSHYAWFDNSGRFISGGNWATGTSETSPSNAYSIRFDFETSKIDKVMFEQGSTATSYEPYTGGKASPNPDYPQNISVVTGDNTVNVVGKNLINISNENWAKGSWTADGEPTDNILNARGLPFIACLPNTKYTISTKNTINALRINEYNEQQGHIQRSVSSGARTFTITTTANTYFLRWSINYDNATTITQTLLNSIELQLEQGSTATTYEPYTEQTQLISLGNIELAKIGDYIDQPFKAQVGLKFYDSLPDSIKANLTLGKWYRYGAIEKFIISAVQSVGTASSGINYAQINCSGLKPMTKVLCTKYLNTFDASTNNTIRLVQNSIYVYDNTFTTKEIAESALIGLNCFCVLATPTTTEITDTTLITQLENMLSKSTYRNTTNMWSIVASGNAEGELEIEYYQDLKTLFNNVNNAIISLGGNV